MSQKYKCPNCGSDEFVTEPNQYDIVTVSEEGYVIQETVQIDEFKVFCRECSYEVDWIK